MMSKLTIIGPEHPEIGKQNQYSIASLLSLARYTHASSLQKSIEAEWNIYVLENEKWRKTTGKAKYGDSITYTFTQKSLTRKGIKLKVTKGEAFGELLIQPKSAGKPKIIKIDLLDINDKKVIAPLSDIDVLVAKAYCTDMDGELLYFTLWEDDAQGPGHNPINEKNKINALPVSARVKKGIAEVRFNMAQYSIASMIANIQMAKGDVNEGKTHKYYVIAEYFRKLKASNNVNIKNSAFEVEYAQEGIKSEVVTVDKDAPRTKIKTGKSMQSVAKQQKEKFEKVVGLGKEAVLYITSEIATEIKVDGNGKIVSYPDSGGYNGMTEYKEGDKLYCKKISATKSAFPLYKMYIYRGNKVGEAVQKLKQDIENKTHENAESTVLTIARHAQTNNKNYELEGPLPPNTIKTLYRIRYMQAWNHAKKESFRYRIVGDNTSNMKPVNDIKKEVSSGAMILLGNRDSISIDPWKSKDLIGCIGIRGKRGENHFSYSDEIKDQSSSNYKNIYHALNNYLETIIPELTGVYGRRGYSSNGKVAVKASEYKEEIKVFVLVDPLPELNKNEK